jgi:hypothetical protein
MALKMAGKDASLPERSMREITARPGYRSEGWSWDELDGWLKRSKISPDRRKAVEKIINELKGEQSAPRTTASESANP